MKRFTNGGLKGLAVLLLIFTAAGCNVVDDLFENDKEVNGVIELIDGNNITLDDSNVYVVDNQTKYDGVSGLADLSVGDEVEIEYKENGGVRNAVEVEFGNDGD